MKNKEKITFEEEPEFILPEKWCVKGSTQNEIDTIFKFNGISVVKDCNYIKGFQHYPPFKTCLNNNATFSWNIKPEYTEITFDQFKKYVLKNEIIEEKVIEPLPQFKVS